MLEKVFSSSSVYVHITHGDITSKPGTTPSKIRTIVCDIVKKYANSNYLKKTNFQQIIHITDTDGAYIPDENVVEDSSVSKTKYSLTEIRTSNADGIYGSEIRQRVDASMCYQPLRRYGIFRISYTICPATWIMYFITSKTLQMKKRRKMQWHL